MSSGVMEAAGWGAAVAALAFVFLLSWRTLRRARRRAGNRAKELAEQQPELRERLARRLGCQVDQLPKMGGWKITPDFACLVADLIDAHRPARVLELGAGSSTVLLSMLLGPHAGALSSLEQDADHVEATRRMLSERGLGDRALVVHAPLQAGDDARDGDAPWYQLAALDGLPASHAGPWDLVIVDGPSTVSRADARFAALPRLANRLAPRAIMVLDDAARPGERAVLAAWRGLGLLQGFDVEELPLARGAVVLRRRD